MKYQALFILILVCGALVGSVQAVSESRYAYISMDKVEIDLVNEHTTIKVYYSLDTHIKVILWLLGTADLKNKLTKILNYENATVKQIGFDYAEFSVEGAVTEYKDVAYWFPEHKFNMVIPSISVTTPLTTLKFYNTDRVERGVAYFKVSDIEASNYWITKWIEFRYYFFWEFLFNISQE